MLPAVLKNFNLFIDGQSFLGRIAEVTLPSLTAITEDYRGAGMQSPVSIDQGMEQQQLEWKPGGHLTAMYAQWGVPSLDGVQLRFAGGYQSDDTGEVRKVEIIVRGKHSEIAPGTAKAGEKGEPTVTTKLVYYRIEEDGRVLIENDVLGMKMIVGGVDRYAELRAAIEA
ncbi:phage major tail tube protein [Asticcacaulis endophyticus]|uniref:Major tail tube protein n=1 Tax=Asticcacaulis endophyticus TaxID=1395890 RepID=A0A918Q502_9CAUL|nr:phage major tail tube protein [Asticcacaulis endophyticus]GGZ31987.1 major tail tube protein [Asticcacaulis endophyticus]